MQINLNQKIPVVLFLFLLALMSCEDKYIYDNKEPDFLDASIYDYMEQDGNFSYFLRLIDDLGYKETLLRTGSKTLFPVRDDAFTRFLENNPYGVKSYEELSSAQKREIMNTSMINMAYLSYMLSNAPGEGGLSEGLAMRRVTANTYLDSIPFVRDEVLFENPYWQRFKSKGLYLLDSDWPSTMVHFAPENMSVKRITNDDFSVLFNGKNYIGSDIYVNGILVVQKDIICKNGYIHVMEDVLLPMKNMAQLIRDNGETNLFNRLMNKFAAPAYSMDASNQVHNYYDGSTPDRPLIPLSDSIFVKVYFSPDYNTDMNGNSLENYGLLHYNPGNNAYTPSSLNQDMGAIFAPTDQAMEDYINGDRGFYLKDAYGSWDNVPTNLLAMFLKNHQKRSFLSALPHNWPTMTDESSFIMNVDKADIKKSYVGSNGVVFVSDNVYPPVDYQCVYGSLLTSTNTSVMNWGVQDATMKFNLYLRSMENMYNLIIPTDEALQNYRDPISWAFGNAPEIWSFRYVPERNTVYADVYSVDESGNKGTRLREVTDASIIRNRLNDIIDMHIVVGEKEGEYMSGYIDDGNTLFAQTKGGASLKIAGSGSNVQITGGGDMERNIEPARIVENPETGNKRVYDSDNGRTFFVDKVFQDPIKSVYTVLGEHPEYKRFFDLLEGDDRVFTFFQGDPDIVPVFDLKQMTTSSGIGYVVNSFGNYQYTVFIPTEEALNRAFLENDKLFSWDEIAAEEDPDLKKEKTLYLLNFLKYHFMDNSVFVDGKPFSGMRFETAARTDAGRFYRLLVNSTGSEVEIANENGTSKARILTSSGLYNIMSRDYIVNNRDPRSATQIVASSRAVIHLIDNTLRYDY